MPVIHVQSSQRNQLNSAEHSRRSWGRSIVGAVALAVVVTLLAGACGEDSSTAGVGASGTAATDGDASPAADVDQAVLDAAASHLQRKFDTDLSGAQLYVTTSTAYGRVVDAAFATELFGASLLIADVSATVPELLGGPHALGSS